MQRRTCLKTMAAALVPAARGADPAHPIQVHVDLAVDPAREQEMLRRFEKDFKPAAARFAGVHRCEMDKLRSAVTGKAPAGLNYRFVLTYQSEELRQKWVTSDPAIVKQPAKRSAGAACFRGMRAPALAASVHQSGEQGPYNR